MVGYAPTALRLNETENIMQEIWKPIDGFEDKYAISNKGNVMSLNYANHGYQKLLTPKVNNKGYEWVELRHCLKIKQCLVHRLVASAFVENPNGYGLINHKDENPRNNSAENLEWCTQKYNVNYSLNLHPDRNRHKNDTKHAKPLVRIGLNGERVECGKLSVYCRENNLNSWSIIQCCKGIRKTAYGYKWEFLE